MTGDYIHLDVGIIVLWPVVVAFLLGLAVGWLIWGLG